MAYYGENELHTIDLKRGDHLINPYPEGFTKSSVPAGKSGKWSVVKKTLTDRHVGLDNLRMIRDGRRDRVIPPGDYTILYNGYSPIMSDTPAEAHEHKDALDMVVGNVLLNGLGLGFFLQAVLNKPEVGMVFVVEKSMDVIRLVGPTFLGYNIPKSRKTGPIFTSDGLVNKVTANGCRLVIINADAFSWVPPKGLKFGFVWHDIWPDIVSTDSDLDEIRTRAAEMSRLRKAYAKRTAAQDCWSAKYLLR